MSLFCCTRPRAYSSSCSPSEVELNPRAPTPVPPSPPPDTRRKAKWVPGPGRRHSKQDIEAFYQEGKRLQQEEELLELGVESLAGHSSAGHNQTVECEPKQSLVACRDDDATAEASSLPQRQSLSCLELASSGLELDNGQNGQQKSGLVGIAVEDIPKVDQSGGNIPCSTMAGLANATPKSAIKLQLPSSADALSKEKHTAEILEKENSIQPGIGTNICADLEEKNDQLDASSRTIARPSMPGAFTPGYPSYSASEVSISHPMDPKELFFKIPMLLEPSSSSLATRSASPSRTFHLEQLHELWVQLHRAAA
ncbi:hypothetical protein DFH27DRAFT_521340 [Peziza echinospora]|nr:hypothetical protein DFH27DRAFT_521340 [Peziza echinospora]